MKPSCSGIDITVAIPVYNRDRFVVRAVESVLNALKKTNLVWEVTILDNHSTEIGTANVLKKLVEKGVRVSRNPKKVDVLSNWNRSIYESNARWIHLLHDDDYVREDFYQKFEECQTVVKENIQMYISGVMSVNEHEEPLAPVKIGNRHGLVYNLADDLAVANLIGNPGVIFKRQHALELGGFSRQVPSYLSDWNFWFKMSLGQFVFVEPVCLAYYTIHAKSGTLNENHIKLSEVRELVADQIRVANINPKKRKTIEYTVGFGRHLIRLNRQQWNYNEAIRMSKETLKHDCSIINLVKTIKCLLIG